MAKGVYEFLEYAADALLDDAPIAAFCSTHFGKSLQVFVGQEENDLPLDSECPCVVMTAGGRGLTGGNHIKVRSGRVLIAVKWEENKAASSLNHACFTYPGLSILDEFSDLVADALVNLAHHTSKYYVSEVTDGPEDSIKHPVYKAWLGLSIQLDSDF